MDNKRLEQIDIIINEILFNPTVKMDLVLDAAKLASEDDYLYDLMVDWAKEVDVDVQNEMLKEMLDYTTEKLRWR